jgi:hypothetical protein
MQFVSKTFGAGQLGGSVREIAEGYIEGILNTVKEGHEKYVESWETDLSTPEFYIGFDYKGAHTLIAYVKMEAESAEDATLSVWQLLNRDDGTEVRYMQISRDWKSKTWPGRFPSGPGAGHTTGLGPAQPGIESKHIADTVETEVMPEGPDIDGAYETGMRFAFDQHEA